MAKISETETVIKKIVPYLQRRGYDVDKDLTFEYPAASTTRAKLGFVDVLVRQNGKIAFLVEAKRIAKALGQKDREQAIGYGNDCKAPFVVLTNGAQFESLNPRTGKRIRWNKLSDRLPSKSELTVALQALKRDPEATEISLSGDSSLPFRPGLPLKQLNVLFARCHNIIRKIERDEDHAFSDFSKLLFLKLLEEKADTEGSTPLYSYRFHELAAKPESEADQVKTAITSMLDTVRTKTTYGDVISETLHLKNAKTFQKLISALSAISFRDTRADSKGAAFEYFVRATLKGKKLGQYFTPRPLIDVMHALIGRDKVLTTLALAGNMRVVDPACGTGGFLVYLMTAAVDQASLLCANGKINESRRDELVKKIRTKVFYGADAHPGVASSAKMNMIVAGDGHSNIQCEDTLAREATVWSVNDPNIDLIVTNPPFGTNESEAMADADLDQFPVKSDKGQILFLQKMIQSVRPGGEICTVIDEGLLNTESGTGLRSYIMEHTTIKGIIALPGVTFKPNKINVKSSVLHLVKRTEQKPDQDDDYPVFFVEIDTLGYHGSGDLIRNFDFPALVNEIASEYHGEARAASDNRASRKDWRWFTRSSMDIAGDKTKRFDLKYWDPDLTNRIEKLRDGGAYTIKELNTIPTKRGRSPNSELYVDEEDGYALVVKAGSSIQRNGNILLDGDYIEKNVFEDFKNLELRSGDILLSSTGDGTLGKCAVFRADVPAIFDGHVTLIRVDQERVVPEYVCDYLRGGFGAAQIARLFTGSTGLIELPPEQVDRILVPLPDKDAQKQLSEQLRSAERAYSNSVSDAAALLLRAARAFSQL